MPDTASTEPMTADEIEYFVAEMIGDESYTNDFSRGWSEGVDYDAGPYTKGICQAVVGLVAGELYKVPHARRPLYDVDNAPLAKSLEQKGVIWPLQGFTPGHSMLVCEDCQGRHLAEAGSIRCLPCAVFPAIQFNQQAFQKVAEKAFADGRARVIEEIGKLKDKDASFERGRRSPFDHFARREVPNPSFEAGKESAIRELRSIAMPAPKYDPKALG